MNNNDLEKIRKKINEIFGKGEKVLLVADYTTTAKKHGGSVVVPVTEFIKPNSLLAWNYLGRVDNYKVFLVIVKE